MRPTCGIVAVIVALAATVSLFCIAGGQVWGNNSADVRLPGARAVIEAARYPTIQAAAGMVLNGTSGIAVAGNLFSGVRPKALTVEGQASKHVLFSDNVLVDTAGDDKKLEASLVKDNLNEE